MAITVTSKAPSERINYLWTPAIAAGDSLTGVVTVTVVSGTADVSSATLVGNDVKLTLISGADGETSQFLATVNTTGGEILQETIYLPVNSTALSPLGAKLVQIFPAFANVAPAAIDYWLDDAALIADWNDDHAQMLLACHNMAVNGLGSNPVSIGLTKFKSGTVDMTFSEAQSNTIGFAQTVYGQQFHILLRRRYAGPFTVGAASLDCPC